MAFLEKKKYIVVQIALIGQQQLKKEREL